MGPFVYTRSYTGNETKTNMADDNENGPVEEVRTMLSADDVADWFLAKDHDTDEPDMSNLKLQKLLYYAQGHHLGRMKSPLFQEDIQAWQHGPVVSSVYHRFKRCGKDVLPLTARNDGSAQVSGQAEVTLEKVWKSYSQMSAWALRERTHSELPWADHYSPGRLDSVIPLESLEAFFSPQYDSVLMRQSLDGISPRRRDMRSPR